MKNILYKLSALVKQLNSEQIMNEHYLTMSITQEQVDSLLAALKTIEANLPSLIELTSEQRKSMAHYSDKELGFIQKTLQVADQYPEIFPANFNIETMRRDVDTLQKLDSMLYALVLLTGKFHDSRFAAGSQSIRQARTGYKFIKTHNQLTGGLEDAVADLSKQYAHNKAAKEPTVASATVS